MKHIYGYISMASFAFLGALALAEAAATATIVVYTAVEPLTVEAAEIEEVIATSTVNAEKLAAYLESKGAPELAAYAAEIMELPRWKEALAITAKETTFCRYGVGASRNNCGGIRSFIEGRGFKIYETKFDSVWDVSYLLQKPRYINRSIADMNGIYCVDEAAGGGPCPNWTETIEAFIAEIEEVVK